MLPAPIPLFDIGLNIEGQFNEMSAEEHQTPTENNLPDNSIPQSNPVSENNEIDQEVAEPQTNETNNQTTNIAPASTEADSDSSTSSNPALTALGEYCPFIADVPISSYADPFPIPHPDTRSDEEIERIKKSLKKSLKSKKFDPPIPLADFCLIAKERWDQEENDSEASIGICLLV